MSEQQEGVQVRKVEDSRLCEAVTDGTMIGVADYIDTHPQWQGSADVAHLALLPTRNTLPAGGE